MSLGGGPYYLVSRSLGPEFGGSIGVIYFFGTVMGCGMNVLGFVEPLISNFGESSGTVYRVLPEGAVSMVLQYAIHGVRSLLDPDVFHIP